MDSTKTLLGRAFRVLCLEWAAAAPPGAAAPAELRARIERLTSLGVDVALIAQAGIDEVDPRLGARPDVEGRLFLLLSDGAEAYVLGPAGPRLIERRAVSPGEDEQLAAAVETVRDVLATRGLATSVRGGDRWRRTIALARPRGGRHLRDAPGGGRHRRAARRWSSSPRVWRTAPACRAPASRGATAASSSRSPTSPTACAGCCSGSCATATTTPARCSSWATTSGPATGVRGAS